MEAYQKLERAFAEFNGVDPAGMVACSSGTAALHLALEAFHLPQGSEVITSDYNMIAVPRACVLAGLKPVFVDSDERLLMDLGLAFNDLTDCEAIIAVHVYGRRFDFEEAAREVGVGAMDRPVIEDLAEAHGVRPHPATDAACFSFYRNKIVAGEEGGAVWFRDQAHAVHARQLRSLGFTPAHDFMHTPRGHNYRMSNVHAELILKSLAEYPRSIEERLAIEGWMDDACPDEWKMPHRDAPWVYDVRLPFGNEAAVKALNAAGIQARFGFKPMTMQPEFIQQVNHPHAYAAAREVMYLPIRPGQTTSTEIKESFRILREIAGKN